MLLWNSPPPCFSLFVNDENSIIFLTPFPPIVPFFWCLPLYFFSDLNLDLILFYIYFLLINIIHIEALLFLVLMISSWLLTVTRLPTTDFFTSLSSWPTTLSLVSRWRTENGDYVIDKFPDLTLTLVTTWAMIFLITIQMSQTRSLNTFQTLI